MISDRHYMRDDYKREPTSVLVWMISIIIAGFIIQNIFEKLLPGGNDTFARIAAMSPGGLLGGHVWKLLTYTFLHEGVLAVLFNCLMLWFLGRELRPLIGEKGLAWLYIAASVGGALAWFGVHLAGGGFLHGATSVVCAFLVVFACIHPDRQMTLLLFFIIPVTIKPKYIAGIWALIALCGLAFSEIPARASGLGMNYSAQIGGMIAGFLFHRLVYLREWRNPDGRTQIELPRWLRRTKKAAAAAAAPKYKVNVGADAAPSAPSAATSPAELRAEVDRILDKINSEGFGALTAGEKRLLDEAKDALRR
jgi:membrane associated rhomboid family serine protease